jgi:hypothetical protein
VTVRQTPAPSQVRAGVSVEPVQLPATHAVPFAYSWQAPAPLQRPLMPQVVTPASMHCVAGVGAWPVGTLVQVPALPVSAQDWQVPVQAVAQQTPWAQKPELHSAAVAQTTPSAFFEQVPPLQTLGDTQSPLTVQLVLQMFIVVSQA